MTKSSILSAVSRIERAPNMSAVVRAYDAALGGSDVSVHRHQGAWQIWHGEASGFCGDFTEIRTHLARDAEEILERTAEEAAPAMAQPAQLQQACAAPAASAAPQRLSRDEILSRIRAHDRERDEAVAEIERRAVNGKPSRLDTWLLDGIRANGAILGEQLSEHDRVAMENPPAAGFRVVKAWVDDADVFQTVTFPMIFERAQDATAEIVSLLGGRDPAKFSAAEREAGAVLTMEEVGPEPGPAPVPLPAQQQQARATRTPTPKPVRIGGGKIVPLAVVPTHAMANFQVAELVRAALDASTPPADAPQAWLTSVSAIEHAALDAYGAALVWIGAYEEGRHAPCDRAYGLLFDARVRLQDAARHHADLVAIEAIGSLGGGWELRPCVKPGHYDLVQEASVRPELQVPQGLPTAAYRALVRAYRRGLEVGRRRVKAAVRRTLNGPTLNLENL